MKYAIRLFAMLLCLTFVLTACDVDAASSAGSSSVTSGSTSTSATASSETSESAADTGVAQKADPTTIVAAVNTEPGRLDPQQNASIAGIMVERQIFEPLIDKDPETGELVPCLATEWSWDDDTHLRVKLREGVKFHNGEDFTAEDVMVTLERIKTGTASASLYGAFDAENSVAEDDYTVVIAFSSPFAPALNFLTNGRAYIVPADYIAENGDTVLDQSPVGTGPFKFVDWTVSSHLNMVRNDEYWGDKASFENLQIRFITDDTARGMALETGELDIAISLQESNLTSIMNGEVPHITAYNVPGQQVNYFAFNPLNIAAFEDVRVRQAMAHAVDWEASLSAANGALFLPCESCLAPTLDYYYAAGTYEYDAEKSKQLLEEAGYGDGFSFTCVVMESQPSVRLLEILQQYWAEIGLSMEITVVDTATWMEALNNGSYDTALGNMTATTGDPHHAISVYLEDGVNVIGKITDEEFNELADAAMVEMDNTKRAELYKELQQCMHDKVLQIPMFVNTSTYGVWDYIDGFYPDAGQQLKFVDMSIITA